MMHWSHRCIFIFCFNFQLGHPNMFLNGEAMTSLEDIRKGSVDDVYNFISEIPSCAEYAQVIQMTKWYYNYIASGLILLCVTCCRHSKTTWLMERRYLFLQRTTSSIHSVWSLGQRLRYDHRYSPSFKRTKFDLNMLVNKVKWSIFCIYKMKCITDYFKGPLYPPIGPWSLVKVYKKITSLTH